MWIKSLRILLWFLTQRVLETFQLLEVLCVLCLDNLITPNMSMALMGWAIWGSLHLREQLIPEAPSNFYEI
jgi:hypothetical protein